MLKDSDLKGYLESYFNEHDSRYYYKFLKDVDIYIKKVLFKKISNRELLEDTTQDIMLGIHNSLDTFDMSKKILPWINSIIFHKTIDFYRKQKRFSSLEQIESHEIEKIEISMEDKFALKEILSALSKDIFGAKYVEQKLMGETIEKVSEDLGLTKANTKVVFHRLTKKIKKGFL